jgi:hypothetical protein
MFWILMGSTRLVALRLTGGFFPYHGETHCDREEDVRQVSRELCKEIVRRAIGGLVHRSKELVSTRGTMHTTGKVISRWLYVTVRDRHVQILGALIILCCFAALGFVLFGRNVAAIILLIAIGCAWMLRFKIWS